MLTFTATPTGYAVARENGQTLALVSTQGTERKKATNGEQVEIAVTLSRDRWLFEFTGRPISEAELTEVLTELPNE